MKWQFKEARRKRLEAVEDANHARRAAKNALFLEAEVARLSRLLEEAGLDPHRGGTEMSLRREVHRLRKAVPGAKAQAAEIDRLRKSLWKSYDDQARLRHLPHEALRLRDKLKGRYRRLRAALKRSVAAKEGLKVRLRRATAPAAADAELRKALRRSRHRKTALNAVTKENTRLRRTVRTLRRRTGTRETEIAKLRATRAVLSKALYGRRSEMRERSGSGRPRGQVRGAPGHGRTPRPGLEERVEDHNPPDEARICAGCGKPYAAVGAEESALVEIEVRAHRRVIRRGRWRRTCGCASSPAEVSAPPMPRLFPNTSYGTSVWSRVLYERYAWPAPGAARRRVAVGPGTAGLRGYAGRQRTPLRAAVRARLPRRSAHTRTNPPRAKPTRPAGVCRPCAAKAVRAAPGCGPRSPRTRPASTSTPRAAPRRRNGCSATSPPER